MFNQGGLSLEQAPPISVVLRFFVTAALFGLFGAGAMFYYGMDIFNPETEAAKLLTHTFALGVMGSFMLGALFQMLPVIAGVVLQTPTRKALFVHTAFTVGVIMLLVAFVTSLPHYYTTAGVLLGGVLFYAIVLMLSHLIRLQNHSASSRGMLVSLAGFLVTLLLALYMLTALAGWHNGISFLIIRELHYDFGLFGWISLLIISISFQVVEMFYVTPPYHDLLRRYLVYAMIALLFLKTILLLVMQSPAIYTDIPLALLLIIYALITLLRLYRRKRPTSDATVWLWRFGMGMLIVTMAVMLFSPLFENPILKQLSYITFAFFALSIVFAMVYKIVPFLVWFHLSNQGYMGAPMMHDIIHPKRVKMHFYLHIILFISIVTALFWNPLFPIAALLLFGSFGWLLYHIGYAIYLYRYTQKHSEKMSW